MKGISRFMVVLLLMAYACMVYASSPETLASYNCEDNFSWMAGSTTPPADTPCRCWVTNPDTSYDWVTEWDPVTQVAQYYLQSPPIQSHTPLQVGGLGDEFQVSNLTLIEFQLSWGLEPKRDGFIIMVSTDHGDSWNEVTSKGITLSFPYNYVMSTSTALDPPPVGLRGIRAYSGTVPKTRIRLDLRASTILGQSALFKLYFVSDASTAVDGIHLYSFNYWDAPLDPPVEVVGTADNSSYILNYSITEDPRVSQTLVLDNGTPLLNPTSPLQTTNLPNDGSSHYLVVRNIDAFGNSAELACSPSPLVPICTGAPPMTLLLMSAGGGHWVQQTAEVPCGNGIPGLVDGYYVYEATAASGPWNLIGTVPLDGTQFYDSTVPQTGNVIFYRVRSIKNGVMEPEIPGGGPPV